MVALGRCGEANDKTEAVNVLVQETWKHGSIYAILSDVKDSVCVLLRISRRVTHCFSRISFKLMN